MKVRIPHMLALILQGEDFLDANAGTWEGAYYAISLDLKAIRAIAEAAQQIQHTPGYSNMRGGCTRFLRRLARDYEVVPGPYRPARRQKKPDAITERNTQIRQKHAAGASIRALAAEFRLGPTQIHRIVSKQPAGEAPDAAKLSTGS